MVGERSDLLLRIGDVIITPANSSNIASETSSLMKPPRARFRTSSGVPPKFNAEM
jgi:hypothetical protein